MKKVITYLTMLSLAFAVAACTKDKGGEEPAAPADTGTEAPAEDSAPAEEPKEEAPKEEAKAPAGDTEGQIGVPECDEYISKVQKCVSEKVPAAAQAMLKESFQKNIDAWKAAAATPEGKQGLAVGCKAALDGAKQSMGAYGCEF